MNYTAPSITELGSVRELTLANNKDGFTPDVFSGITGVIGSLVPAHPKK